MGVIVRDDVGYDEVVFFKRVFLSLCRVRILEAGIRYRRCKMGSFERSLGQLSLPVRGFP